MVTPVCNIVRFSMVHFSCPVFLDILTKSNNHFCTDRAEKLPCADYESFCICSCEADQPEASLSEKICLERSRLEFSLSKRTDGEYGIGLDNMVDNMPQTFSQKSATSVHSHTM